MIWGVDLFVEMKGSGVRRQDIKDSTIGVKEEISGGVIGLEVVHSQIHLRHFWVPVEKRSNENARRLVRMFENIVKNSGHKFAIVHAENKRSSVERFIKYYWKTAPYEEKDGVKFYLVEV